MKHEEGIEHSSDFITAEEDTESTIDGNGVSASKIACSLQICITSIYSSLGHTSTGGIMFTV